MTMKGALHPRSVVHKFYVARGSVEKGLIGWEDCVRSEKWHVKNKGELPLGVTDVGVTEKEDAKSRFDLKKELIDCEVKCWKERKMSNYVVREIAGNYRDRICREVGFESINRSSHN